jgi:putative transposase
MTAPRLLLRGASYLVTRRCLEQRYFLTPTEETTATFAYLLALAARRYRIRLHAWCVMSNHFHLVLTDPDARLPEFHRFLDGLLARAVNSQHGRRDHFWQSNTYNAVRLATPEDIVAKAAYTLANPVAARAVRHGRTWPGLWSSPTLAGAAGLRIARPKHFFTDDGGMPAEVELTLTTPPGFESARAYRRALEAELGWQEDRAAQGVEHFEGVLAVRRQRWDKRPKAVEPPGGIKPRLAGREEETRSGLLDELEAFLEAYQDALLAWREKRRRVVFPAGTHLMRVAHAVACAEGSA